jgi:hypothetical protein
MPEDNRTSARVTSDTVTLTAGDDTPVTVLDLADDQTLALGYLKVEYSSGGSVESEIVFYDEDANTSAGGLADDLEGFYLSSGERETIDDPFLSEVEEGLVVDPDGSSDAEIRVTAGGALITG